MEGGGERQASSIFGVKTASAVFGHQVTLGRRVFSKTRRMPSA